MAGREAWAEPLYPMEPRALRDLLGSLVGRGPKKRWRGIAGIVPHGRMRGVSGGVAASFYGQVEMPKAVLMVGPDHTGQKQGIWLGFQGEWETPLGTLPVDSTWAALIRQACASAEKEKGESLHRDLEQALEAQIPFLQYKKVSRFVPLLVGKVTFQEALSCGQAIAAAVRKSSQEVLLVASTHLTCYESPRMLERRDPAIRESLVTLDAKRLWQEARRRPASMCGLGAAVVVMEAARSLGAHRGTVFAYEVSRCEIGSHVTCTGCASILWHEDSDGRRFPADQ